MASDSLAIRLWTETEVDGGGIIEEEEGVAVVPCEVVERRRLCLSCLIKQLFGG